MLTETIRALIAQADQAIREERFDDLMEFYTEDAVLVVRPGLEQTHKILTISSRSKPMLTV